MANRANAASISGAIGSGYQKYFSSLNIIRSDIARAKQAQSKAGGDAGNAWGRIEKLGVNKKGAQMAAAVLAMEADSSQDVIRTFVNILACAGRIPEPDLMDLAERLSKNEIAFSRGDDNEPEGAGGDDGDEDAGAGDGDGNSDGDGDGDGAEEEAEEEPEPTASKTKPRADRVSPAEARKRAQEHLSVVE